MSRKQKDPLRFLSQEEHHNLKQLSRSTSQPAVQVTRAKALLAVETGWSYTEAAAMAGYRMGDTVAKLVSRLNQEGMSALQPRHEGGTPSSYGGSETERILIEVRRVPEQTGRWDSQLVAFPVESELTPGSRWLASDQHLHHLVHFARGGLHVAEKPDVVRNRQSQTATQAWHCHRQGRRCSGKKKLIERAHLVGERLGLAVWNADEAGPYQTIPYAGSSWQPEGKPATQPHEYIRNGTAKLLTLFHPTTGKVHVKGVLRCTNAVLHPWLKEELTAILRTLPEPAILLNPQENRAVWESWRKGLKTRVSLLADLPPLRMLLIWDNLAGHKTPALLCWMFSQGILPLLTPLGGSWLNMAESIQRIIVRRALEGQHPTNPWQIIESLEAVADHWNVHPTPFVWGGKRSIRRKRARERRHALGGSGACIHQPARLHPTLLTKWL